MKKIFTAMLICLTCLSAVGCSDSALQALKRENEILEKKVAELEVQPVREALPEDWYKSEGFAAALGLLDDYIEGSGARLGITEKDELQLVRLDRISERYYLAAYMIAPVQPLTNSLYALVDLENEDCRGINLDTDDYINEITYDQSSISFYCAGQNVMNGFRKFPHVFRYDIAGGGVSTEYLYKSLKASESEILLGNWLNRAGLGNVAAKDKAISFSFTDTEGTVPAGGALCPNIKVGLKQDDNEQQRTMYVDIENLVVTIETRKKLEELSKLDFISEVSFREYTDVHETPHAVIYFKFKGVQEYSCSFREGSNGFMELVLMLR